MKKVFTLLIIILSFVFVYNIIMNNSNINEDLSNNDIDTSNLVSKDEFEKLKNDLSNSNTNIIECEFLPNELNSNTIYKVSPLHTPIPVNGFFDFTNVYFNTNLSTDEIIDILSSLNYYSSDPDLPVLMYCLNCIVLSDGEEPIPSLAFIHDPTTGLYAIISLLTESILFTNQFINEEYNSLVYSMFARTPVDYIGLNEIEILRLYYFLDVMSADMGTNIVNLNNSNLDVFGNDFNNNILKDFISCTSFDNNNVVYYYFNGIDLISLNNSSSFKKIQFSTLDSLYNWLIYNHNKVIKLNLYSALIVTQPYILSFSGCDVGIYNNLLYFGFINGSKNLSTNGTNTFRTLTFFSDYYLDQTVNFTNNNDISGGSSGSHNQEYIDSYLLKFEIIYY